MPDGQRTGALPLRVVDGRRLPKEFRDALHPGGTIADQAGTARQLPRYFYEVPSWQAATEIALAPHFQLYEFIHTDVREAEPLRHFPRYVPCAIVLLAAALEALRRAVDTTIHISANGGYRSPRHRLMRGASTHAWGTAVNIYKVGDDLLDTRGAIEEYADVAREVLPGVWVRPYGSDIGEADDHLHLDLGYVLAVPREAPGEIYNPKLDAEPL